jgi:hypothetical protein
VQRPQRSNGFVISVELSLIALVLVLGLVTAWAKLRDQSLSEFVDTMAAVDTYIVGAGTLWQTGGTRWIKDGTVVDPTSNAAVSEQWIDADNNMGEALAAEPVPGSPGVYRTRQGFLLYTAPAGETAP